MRPAVTACAALATAAALWSWLRRRRRRELARRYAYELLGDPRVRRSLDPYPSSTTVAALAALTGVAAAKVRKFSASARDGAGRPQPGAQDLARLAIKAKQLAGPDFYSAPDWLQVPRVA